MELGIRNWEFGVWSLEFGKNKVFMKSSITEIYLIMDLGNRGKSM